MNTHRKAPKTNFSHDWLKATETWRQKKSTEDILWHQQYFRPGVGGAIFVRALLPHDSSLSTPVHESWLRSFKALTLCHVFPYIPNCSSLEPEFWSASPLFPASNSTLFTQWMNMSAVLTVTYTPKRQIQLDVNFVFSLPSRETSRNLCFVFLLLRGPTWSPQMLRCHGALRWLTLCLRST